MPARTPKRAAKKPVAPRASKPAKAKTAKRPGRAAAKPTKAPSQAAQALVQEGQPAPDVALVDHEGREFRLRDLRGKWVVLYFYPQDDTPGCTTEACQFQAALPNYEDVETVVMGVSPDDAASHQKFRAKYGLGFPLASDPKKKAIEAFGVWKLKNLYGRTYWGVERSTFLLDPQGIVRGAWRRVKPDGHAAQVFEVLRSAQKARGD